MKNVKLLIELTASVYVNRYSTDRFGNDISRVRIEMLGWGGTTITEKWKRNEWDGWNKFSSFKNGIHDYDKLGIQYGLRR